MDSDLFSGAYPLRGGNKSHRADAMGKCCRTCALAL